MSKSKVIYLEGAKVPIEKPFHEKQWFKSIAQLITFLIGKIPPLRRYVSKSIPYLKGRIPVLYRQGKYIEALELSSSPLIKCYKSDEIHHYWWWSFMSYAVYCAYLLENSKIMNILVQIGEKGLEPFEGREASYCYCQFSNFKYTQEDYDNAIRFAEIAKNADDTSGEAYYLLGYYDLFINEKDPIVLFKLAIERNNEILKRIINHPSIKEYPGIINELTKLHSKN